ncbi:MAG: PQQ-dependent sugar dehydrogenase [Anaerolineae bacterium]|nr:PQQ-dependent sugar dehydrogenase [Anaerolineae bacterium]
MIRKVFPLYVIAALVFGACQPAVLNAAGYSIATYTPTAVQPAPALTATAQPIPVGWKSEVVAEGLEVPWSIIFTSAERMLVSERPGRIREIVDGKLNPNALYTFTDLVSIEESGLMGLALDPDYAENHFFYACYTSQNQSGMFNRVVRMIDKGNEISLDAVVVDNIPSAKYHAGCRLAFGPDGKLYITSGDARQPQAAQDLSSLAGKILRVNPDGSIPQDNPFRDSLVFSYGHRNPQGITWNSTDGIFYESEHGPSGNDGPAGGDEINRIEAGSNYGWPLVSHDESLAGTQSPLMQFTPAIAPAAILFYSSATLPLFQGKLLLGALRGEGLAMLSPAVDDPNRIEKVEWLVRDVGRVREVSAGPDGTIYFSTSNRDGRGNPRTGDDKIYRITPVY